MSDFKPTLNEQEKAYANSLLLALELFLKVRPTMPLQYVMAFLRVAVEEGKGVTEYAAEAGVAPTVMTRHLLDIGDRNREGAKGFGLVTQARDRNDLRRTHTRITPEGKALMRSIIHALRTLPR